MIFIGLKQQFCISLLQDYKKKKKNAIYMRPVAIKGTCWRPFEQHPACLYVGCFDPLFGV